MTQAGRVLSTPPTNTPVDTTRRHLLTIAAGGAVAALSIAAAQAAAAQTLDAELIELGARLEPLVDRYYVAQRRWSGSLARAHAEHDQEFGDPADRNYAYPTGTPSSDVIKRHGLSAEMVDFVGVTCENHYARNGLVVGVGIPPSPRTGQRAGEVHRKMLICLADPIQLLV
jgi:hypothetical protein